MRALWLLCPVLLAGCGAVVPAGPAGGGPDQAGAARIPDGVLVFARTRQGSGEIYTVRTDGSGERNLTNHPADDSDPAWTPDGGQIVFASDRGGDMDLWIMRADGSTPRALRRARGLQGQPEVSPDGQQVAFISVDGGARQVWVVRIDGTGARQVTDLATEASHPDWSPDGRYLLFSTRNGSVDIYRVRVDTGAVTAWRATPRSEHWTDWSQAGVLLHWHREGKGWIFLAGADGTIRRQLTSCTFNRECDEAPSWSPDGTAFAFHRYLQEVTGTPSPASRELYVGDLNGRLRRLTNNAVEDCCPRWRP